MPPKQRAALAMRFYLGLNLEETAEVSDTSRGLAQMRELLAAEDIDLTVGEIGEFANADA